SQQVFENPLAALYNRGAIRIRRHGENAALREQATAAGISQFDAAELRSVNAGNAVELSKPLVHIRVLRVQELGDGPVLAQDRVEEQLGFLLERAAQAVVEFRILI